MEVPLLTLPAELHNQIYQDVAAHTPVLRITPQGFACPPALLRGCKQSRDEAYELTLSDINPNIAFEAHITEFDFTPIIDFLKRALALYEGRVTRLKITITIINKAERLDRIQQWWQHAKTDSETASGHESKHRTTICAQRFLVQYTVHTPWQHRFGGTHGNHYSGVDGCNCMDFVPCAKGKDWMAGTNEETNTLDLVRREEQYAHERSLRAQSKRLGLPICVLENIAKYYLSETTTPMQINRDGGLVPLPLMAVNHGLKEVVLKARRAKILARGTTVEAVVLNCDYAKVLSSIQRYQDLAWRWAHETWQPLFVKITHRRRSDPEMDTSSVSLDTLTSLPGPTQYRPPSNETSRIQSALSDSSRRPRLRVDLVDYPHQALMHLRHYTRSRRGEVLLHELSRYLTPRRQVTYHAPLLSPASEVLHKRPRFFDLLGNPYAHRRVDTQCYRYPLQTITSAHPLTTRAQHAALNPSKRWNARKVLRTSAMLQREPHRIRTLLAKKNKKARPAST